MSNYQRIHCLDCKEDIPYGQLPNWGEEAYVKVLEYLDAFADIAATKNLDVGWSDIEVKIRGSDLDVQWLNKHREHDLVVMSEYHEYYLKADGTKVEVTES